jgi:hypothetical protein
MKRWLPAACLFAVMLAAAPGQAPRPTNKTPPPMPKAPEDEKPQIRPFPTPESGIRVALADAGQLVVVPLLPFAPFYRYIWIPSTNTEDGQATVVAINYISRASFPIRPVQVPCPGGALLRIDLRDLFPKDKDFLEGTKAWEDLAFDPQFSLLLTKDLIDLSDISLGSLLLTDDHITDVVRVDPPDIDPALFAALRSITRSNAPIVDYRYFTLRALSSIRDDDDKGDVVWKTIFGGLYYQLRGIRKANEQEKKDGATDVDVFLAELGVGNLAAKESFSAFLDRVGGDLRANLFESEVAARKNRAVIGVHSSADREGGSEGFITLDLRRKSIDAKQSPSLSQIKPLIDALEVIFTGKNRMPIFSLYSGFDEKGKFQGKLLEKAADDVVSDRSVPPPYLPELQSGISCIRCHGPYETWQPLKDEVGVLLQSGRLLPFTDLSQRADRQVQDRILGLHSIIPGLPSSKRGQRILDKQLQRQRDDFSEVVAELTGEWPRLKAEQSHLGKAATQKIADIYADYWYTPVGACTALRDLGLDVPEEMAVEVFDRLITRSTEPVVGVTFEDPRFAGLSAGMQINRADWSLIRSFAAGRAKVAMAALLGGKQ